MAPRTAPLALLLAAALALASCGTSGGDSASSEGDGERATTTAEETTTTADDEPAEDEPSDDEPSEDEPSDDEPSGDASYDLEVPDDWEEMDGPIEDVRYWSVGPVVDGFQPNVNVLTQPNLNGDLESYVDLSIDSLETTFPDGEVHDAGVEEGPDGEPQAVLDYSATTQGHELHFFATAVVVGDEIVLATFTVPETEWEALGPDVEDALRTLQAT